MSAAFFTTGDSPAIYAFPVINMDAYRMKTPNRAIKQPTTKYAPSDKLAAELQSM